MKDRLIVNGEPVLKLPFRLLQPEIPSTTYLTHGIHSHPAKFIPQIPRYFISKYSKRGETVLDPFCGSGTTLLEAMITGRNAIGIDINPLAILIAKVKTTPIEASKLKKEGKRLLANIQQCKNDNLETPTFPNVNHWYEPEAKIELARIKKCIDKYKKKDGDLYDFFRVTFSTIVRSASNADPRISKPTKTKRMRKLLEKGRNFHIVEDFEKQLENNIKAMAELDEEINKLNNSSRIRVGHVTLIEQDARCIGLPEESVDLIVTSPPFINAQNYYRTFKLQLFWLELINPQNGSNFHRSFIGSNGILARDYLELHLFGYDELDKIIKKIYKSDKKRAFVVYKYFQDMKQVLRQFKRVLKPRKYCCMTLSDNTIRGINIPTHKFIIWIAEDLGFNTILVGADPIRNRSLMTKRAETAGLMDVEWAMIFRKKT
jgi:DNA modification methylase